MWHKRFSHLYIEEGAENYPLTKLIQGNLPNARTVRIRNYKDFFARPSQNFQVQKQSPKLILAAKKDNWLYEGSQASQDFGYRNFYYNSLLLNCIYNCDYCYLQGMYPGGNLVVFVNEDDFYDATRQAIEKRQFSQEPLYLCISYDTDLLAFERIVPYTSRFIEFTRQNQDMLIEVRTKSANWRVLENIVPLDRCIFAWTLSPPEVASDYEKLTPRPELRLLAIERCLDLGWPVRLCFDPVLRIPNWKTIYTNYLREVLDKLNPRRIRDVSLGVFRMNKTYFMRVKKQRLDSPILFYPYSCEDSLVTYSLNERREIAETLAGVISEYIPEDRIEVWC